MAQHTLSLGRLDLVSTTSDLRLQLASSAQVATFDHESATAHSLMSGNRHDIWTTLSADFHVVIELLNLPEQMLAGQLDLHERLARLLHELPLWQQLQFRPSATEITVQSPRCAASLRIYINHAAETLGGLTHKMHKLAQNVPYRDIEPPDGIRRAELRAVTLCMKFPDARNHKRRQLPAPRDNDDGTRRINSTSILNSTYHDSPSMLKCRRTLTTPDRIMSLARSGRSGSTGPFPTCDEQPFRTGLEGPMQSLKRSFSTSDINADSSTECEADVIALIAASLHYAIDTPAKRPLKAIEVVGREAFRPLRHIWPAIFSPGHIQSNSARAVFLPTVAHALTRVCGTQARSVTLRSKFAEVIRRQPPQCSEDDTDDTMQNRLSRRLWQTLQHGLRTGNHAARVHRSAKIGDVSSNTSLHTAAVSAESLVELIDNAGNVAEHVNEDAMADEPLFDDHEPCLFSMHALAAGSWPRPPPNDHAIDTRCEPRARDECMLDAEEDLLSICGSVNSLTLEESGCVDIASGPCVSTASTIHAESRPQDEELLVM